MTSALLRRLVAPLVAMLFLLPAAVSFGQFGAARKAKDAKDAKEAKEDAAKDTDANDADSKDAKDKSEKKDGPGFGSARKGAKDSKDKDSKDDDSDGDDEKESIDPAKRKLMNLLNKKLGKKKDGFFVFWVSETMYSKPDPDAAGAATPPPRTRSGFIETTTAEAKVLETKDTTLEFLVDYLSEYPPPDPKANRRRKKNEPIPTPLPMRRWSEQVDWFPESAEAHAVQERLQEKLDAQLSGKAKK